MRIEYRAPARWICEPPPQDALLPSWEHRTPEQCFRSVAARAYLQGRADEALRRRVMFRETRQFWLFGASAEEASEIYRRSAESIGLDAGTIDRLFPRRPTNVGPR